MKPLACLLLVLCGTVFAQTAPSVTKLYDGPFSTIERELVPLVEAMSESQLSFVPAEGEFKGARTFAQQATHVAAVIYVVSAKLLGEANPVDMGTNENGPSTLKTKADVVKFVKDAFAYGHKGLATVNATNQLEMIPSPFGQGKVPRGSAASILTWHSFDHYGQMAVYARMNGVVPPASRGN
ncbi:DinB family protein [uncultured Paludibaculum sp.]|uniref:DinB family protein n=1 Tax=uncultured Paludibaculum sp. TaxID=1765020 RepID=UPI002AAAE48A|nr:DinB family protein [uncultured Paludibaculum sp.]